MGCLQTGIWYNNRTSYFTGITSNPRLMRFLMSAAVEKRDWAEYVHCSSVAVLLIARHLNLPFQFHNGDARLRSQESDQG